MTKETLERLAEACDDGADTLVAEAENSTCKDCKHRQCLRLIADNNATALVLRDLARAIRAGRVTVTGDTTNG